MNMNKLTRLKQTAHKTKINMELDDILGGLPLPSMDTGKKDYKSFASKYHSLFIEKDKSEIEKIRIPLADIKTILSEEQKIRFGETAPEAALELSAPEVEYNKYSLNIGDFMHMDGEEIALNNIIYEIDRAQEEDVITISISSHGGLIDEYLRLKNHIVSSFDGHITTICDPMAYSAGAMLFLIGDQRIVYEDCSLMFHTYSSGYYGKSSDVVRHVTHNEERFNKLFYRELVVPGYMTEEEYKEYRDGKEFWLTFDKLIERGLATHVYTDGGVLSVEEYQEVMEILDSMDEEDCESEDASDVEEDVTVDTAEEVVETKTIPTSKEVPEVKKVPVKKVVKKPTVSKLAK